MVQKTMANLTINDFWKRRLSIVNPNNSTLVRGWQYINVGLPTFIEAPLKVNSDLSKAGDEETSSLILVSAPGAVGKSTLARQVAFETGAVYIDLATTEPVGGNTLSGGLVKSGLYSAYEADEIAVLIDGLDEARFRVTQEAFEAFLADVAGLASGRGTPTVLLGRTGAIQDAWLSLDSKAAVLEIGYYGSSASIDFAEAQLRAIRRDSSHADVERRAIQLLLERLRAQTESDGDRFAGYAPVLRAVAERVAGVGNAAALIAEIEKGEKPVTLQTVVAAILDRERAKLGSLQFENPKITQSLYSAEEQLDRLVARLYDLPLPPLPISMTAKDARIYATALQSWVPEHPFLDGNNSASSAVFEAAIAKHALLDKVATSAAIRRELSRGAAANPFLSEFYIKETSDSDILPIPPEHIGILYSSLRARLSIGDTASLIVETPDGAELEDALRADVEITLARHDAERPRTLRFSSEQTGVLRLGGYVEDVEIDAPHATVEIGPGPEAILVAPLSIQCEKISFSTEKVVAEAAMGRKEDAIFLEARKCNGAQINSIPIVRGSVSFRVCWPGAKSHPWTNFVSEAVAVADPRLDEALRRFRKIIIAFRSHSKGNLARYKYKIEHARMTKGSGQAVLDRMIQDGIISLRGAMYYLDPDVLGSLTGATYGDCMNRQFSERTLKYVSLAL